MRRLAAERLLPGEGDDVELVEGEVAGQRRPRSRRRSSGPARSAGIQSPFGTRTPEVVPFQVKTTSRAKSTCGQVRQLAVVGLDGAGVVELELLDDVGDPAEAEALPGEHVDAALRRAATTAPSRRRRYRKPARCRSGSRPGTSSTARVRSMACLSLALPILARCERPSAASADVQRPAGPLGARTRGIIGIDRPAAGLAKVCHSTLSDRRPSLGRGVPPRD